MFVMKIQPQSEKQHPQPPGENELPVGEPAGEKIRQDPVDDTSEDSFPASDPPAWTPTTGNL
jgi:hypothetical protein